MWSYPVVRSWQEWKNCESIATHISYKQLCALHVLPKQASHVQNAINYHTHAHTQLRIHAIFASFYSVYSGLNGCYCR